MIVCRAGYHVMLSNVGGRVGRLRASSRWWCTFLFIWEVGIDAAAALAGLGLTALWCLSVAVSRGIAFGLVGNKDETLVQTEEAVRLPPQAKSAFRQRMD